MPATLQQAQAFEPAITWLWDINFSGVDGLPELPDVHASNINFPKSTIDTKSRFIAGTFVNLPHFTQTPTFDIEFNESADFKVWQFLQAWRSKIVDDDNNYSLPKDFFGIMTLRIYDSTKTVRVTGELGGVWPSQETPPQFQTKGSELLTTTCTFCAFASKVNFANLNSLALAQNRIQNFSSIEV